MRKIISISGEAMTGKDSFAEPLLQQGYVKGSFAGNLKHMVETIFGLNSYFTDTQEGKALGLIDVFFTPTHLEQVIDWVKKTHAVSIEKATMLYRVYIQEQVRANGTYKQFHTTREILQFIGTEIVRVIDSNYHVDVLIKTIQTNPDTNYVITDSRFSNERTALSTNFDTTLVRIKRPSYTPNLLMYANPNPEEIAKLGLHASEADMVNDSEYDLIVVNDGTIEDLQTKARNLII